MKKKIAFVVQRYGLEINGGSELHCRQVAERLLHQYDVTVLTSCAIDHMTWKNEYAPGETDVNGVRVLRFPVDKPRVYKKFDKKYSSKAFADTHDWESGILWQQAQGPHCTGLLHHLSTNKGDYNAIVFMTYLYSPTYFGIHIAPEKSLMIPTAHDEPPIYLNIFASEFNLPKYFIYNTETEKEFINARFKNSHIPSCIAGVGIDVPENTADVDLAERYGLTGDYIVYLGRIDEGKNVGPMVEDFIRYRERTGQDITLVLAGKSTIKLPEHKSVLPVGFVGDDEKVSLLRKARAMVLPSQFESLSMSTLEAMYLETPVLLNGNCDVLKRHVEKSGGGLYYYNSQEFDAALDTLLADAALCREMGRKGREYVRQNYQWDAIIQRIIKGIEYVDAL